MKHARPLLGSDVAGRPIHVSCGNVAQSFLRMWPHEVARVILWGHSAVLEKEIGLYCRAIEDISTAQSLITSCSATFWGYREPLCPSSGQDLHDTTPLVFPQGVQG